MTTERFEEFLTLGENIKIEFKRFGNGIETDTCETVCAFLNRFGGNIFLGVDDDGKVVGMPKKTAKDMMKNFITVVDTLGSGVRNLFTYAKHYQHSRPEMLEHDIFQTTVYFQTIDRLEAANPTLNIVDSTINLPVNPTANSSLSSHTKQLTEGPHVNPYVNTTVDSTINNTESTINYTINSTESTINSTINHELSFLTNSDKRILELISMNSQITQSALAKELGITRDGIAKRIRILAEHRIISRTGARKNGSWIVNINIDSIKQT